MAYKYMRTNIYKDKIIAVLQKSHLLSISDIHKKIAHVDYSTVYRNVEQLITENKIKKVVLDKDSVMYEINEDSCSHDHFLCTNCGSVDEVKKAHQKTHMKTHSHIALSNKYIITEILFKGLCGKCACHSKIA